MASRNSPKELEVLQQMISGLSSVEKDAQVRLLQTVATYLQIEAAFSVKKPDAFPFDFFRATGKGTSGQVEPKFSEREELTPKEFILQKDPKTDVERIVCLAYYLTHYRETAHFKTLDLSKLNTEAAQRKFSNAAVAVRNAGSRGLVVPASRGHKQLSAMGEQFVQALPEREAAKGVLNRAKPRRAKRSHPGGAKSGGKKERVQE